jgi:serine protein kinase
MTSMFERIKARSSKPRFMPLTAYLEECRDNPSRYATAPERLLKAIGEPVVTNTARAGDPRNALIFQNRTIRTFPTFSDFYGIETPVEDLYNFLLAASQGLEESKQILYFLGPVGSAKSSLAERLKDLMELEPIYVLAVQQKDKSGTVIPDKFTLSPMYESPLGLFPKSEAAELETTYGIPKRLIDGICSPWATKRLGEFEGDVSQFWVAEMLPSRLREIGIAKTEPGDDNNQDVSSLVGKVDVRKLEMFATDDADAYSFSGALNKASQGLMEFVEMFKAPIKTLHPLLTATQERNFLGTEAIGAMPFRGMVIAHSNEAEWEKFRSDKRNEAFLDRVKIVRVKYNLRLTEEQLIYKKLLSGSALANIPIAPFSLELLGRTVIASRLKGSAKLSSKEMKLRIYDGQDLRDEKENAPTLFELSREAGYDEGMTGISTRAAFKIISRAANSGEEIGLDPIELLRVSKEEIDLAFGGEGAKEHREFLDNQSKGWLANVLGDMIRESLLENYGDFAQTRFERYYDQASTWINPQIGVYTDPDTGQQVEKEDLDRRLKEIEIPAKIPNNKDFRQEIVRFVMSYRMNHSGDMPRWDDYQPMKRVIKAVVEKHTTDLLPLIKFEPKRDAELEKKHVDFLARMKERGFTEVQVRRVVSWYEQISKSS